MYLTVEALHCKNDISAHCLRTDNMKQFNVLLTALVEVGSLLPPDFDWYTTRLRSCKFKR